ncbi:glycosyltransferase family 2 protein [Vibrio metschnikovii]|nr:glycosyltransferase family 2 protein [Vibrio metschnikovii]
MKYEEQLRFLIKSKDFHGSWYKNEYPDVDILKMNPAEHFLKYGSSIGRKPNKFFDTKFYADKYLDNDYSLNPLIHYIKRGKGVGYAKSLKNYIDIVKSEIGNLRNNLYVYGFQNKPIEDLVFLSNSACDYFKFYALRELALYYLRSGDESNHIKAFDIFTDCLEVSTSLKLTDNEINQLNFTYLMSAYLSNKKDEAIKYYNHLELSGKLTSDIILISSMFFDNIELKIDAINRCLSQHFIPPIYLYDQDDQPYNLLTSSCSGEKVFDANNKVSILIATYNAEDTLPVTIRCLQEQTWQNIEIIILDDLSSDNTEAIVKKHIEKDDRIKYFKMSKNAGAYVARNYGLDVATGNYVTIHDADDWSHPIKIEKQVRYLIANEDVVGCTSQQARAYDDLTFSRWTGNGDLIITNTSSFMFKKEKVKNNVGYWDTVRFSADNEFIRRIKKAFGKESVVDLETGPLSFQRDSHTSVVSSAYFGINGSLFGARREYLDSQKYIHDNRSSVYLAKDQRIVPAPVCMRGSSTINPDGSYNFDIVIVSDFRKDKFFDEINEIVKDTLKNDKKLALVQVCDYNASGSPLDKYRRFVDGVNVFFSVYGETIEADICYFFDNEVFNYEQKIIPVVKAKEHILFDRLLSCEQSINFNLMFGGKL